MSPVLCSSTRGSQVTPRLPIRRGQRAYTRRAGQSEQGRGHIPAGRTNQTRGEGICSQVRAKVKHALAMVRMEDCLTVRYLTQYAL
eukprot:6540962-Pyramimonas_sp.AAC.1